MGFLETQWFSNTCKYIGLSGKTYIFRFDLGPGHFPVLLKENPLGVFPHKGGNKWVSEIVKEICSKSCIPFKDIGNVLSGYMV